ncbi:MAG: hypothetical protein GY853_14490 [PVC group bacterium]|nr:hypothetical protein [PVC group bacterium]
MNKLAQLILKSFAKIAQMSINAECSYHLVYNPKMQDVKIYMNDVLIATTFNNGKRITMIPQNSFVESCEKLDSILDTCGATEDDIIQGLKDKINKIKEKKR